MDAARSLFTEFVGGDALGETIGAGLGGGYDSRRLASRRLAARVIDSLVEDDKIADYVIEILDKEYIKSTPGSEKHTPVIITHENRTREKRASLSSGKEDGVLLPSGEKRITSNVVGNEENPTSEVLNERRVKGGIVALGSVLIHVWTRYNWRNLCDIIRNTFLVKMREGENVRWYACEGLYNILRVLPPEQTSKIIAIGLLEEVVQTILDLGLKIAGADKAFDKVAFDKIGGHHPGGIFPGHNNDTSHAAGYGYASNTNYPSVVGETPLHKGDHVAVETPLEMLNQLVLEKLANERSNWSGTWERCALMTKETWHKSGSWEQCKFASDWVLFLIQNYQTSNASHVVDLIIILLRFMESIVAPFNPFSGRADDPFSGTLSDPVNNDPYATVTANFIVLHGRGEQCLTHFYERLGKQMCTTSRGPTDASFSSSYDPRQDEEEIQILLLSNLLDMLLNRIELQSSSISLEEEMMVGITKWTPAKAISWNMLWKLLQLKSAKLKWYNSQSQVKESISGDGSMGPGDNEKSSPPTSLGVSKGFFYELLRTLLSLITGLARENPTNTAPVRENVRDLASFLDIFYEMHQFLVENLLLHVELEPEATPSVFYLLLKTCEDSSEMFNKHQSYVKDYVLNDPDNEDDDDDFMPRYRRSDESISQSLCKLLRHGIVLRMGLEWFVARLARFGVKSFGVNSDSRERFIKMLSNVLQVIHEFNELRFLFHRFFGPEENILDLTDDLALLQSTVDILLENLMLLAVNTCYGLQQPQVVKNSGVGVGGTNDSSNAAGTNAVGDSNTYGMGSPSAANLTVHGANDMYGKSSPLSMSPRSEISRPDGSSAAQLIESIIDLSRAQVESEDPVSSSATRELFKTRKIFWHVLYQVIAVVESGTRIRALHGIYTHLLEKYETDLLESKRSKWLFSNGDDLLFSNYDSKYKEDDRGKFDLFLNFVGWLVISEPIDELEPDISRRLARTFACHAGPCVNLGMALFVLHDYTRANTLLSEIYFPLFDVNNGTKAYHHLRRKGKKDGDLKFLDEDCRAASEAMERVFGTEVAGDYMLHELHKLAHLLEQNSRVACDLVNTRASEGSPLVAMFHSLLMMLPQLTDSRRCFSVSPFAQISKRLLGATYGH